jgi:serine protease Do
MESAFLPSEVKRMQSSVPNASPSRRSRWPLALASGLAAVALTGSVYFGLPNSSVQAQQRPDAGVMTPFGRAPLSFADIVERVKPAVVSIQVSSGGPNIARNDKNPGDKGDKFNRGGRGSPRDLLPDLPDDHPLNEFFRNLPKDFRGGPRQAQGSGFVISADGYVVTNNHVIDGGGRIQVSFDRDSKFDAELVGTDQRTDLALLKIKADGKTFPHVKFARSVPRVGDWVIAVGNPFGLGGTVTAGIVSAQGRDIGSGPYDYMQIDAAVNKGNSGGPTFNLDGEVVGVNTAIYSPSGGNVGIAFAIPAVTATEVIEQLKTSGSVKRGWLGVRIQSLDEDMAASLGLNETKGALVNDVTAPGPAAEAGIKNGDTILSVNGTRIADSRDLARQIATYSPGSKVEVKVLRAQREMTIPVTLGTMPTNLELAKAEPPGRPQQGPEVGQLGITIAPNKEGVMITDVDGGSDAGQKGIRVGDLILEIGGFPVTNPEDVSKAVREANKLQRKAVLMRIKSGSETRFVAVQLKRG